MARKREINYFKDIKNDEELEEFLNQAGLISMDKNFSTSKRDILATFPNLT